MFILPIICAICMIVSGIFIFYKKKIFICKAYFMIFYILLASAIYTSGYNIIFFISLIVCSILSDMLKRKYLLHNIDVEDFEKRLLKRLQVDGIEYELKEHQIDIKLNTAVIIIVRVGRDDCNIDIVSKDNNDSHIVLMDIIKEEINDSNVKSKIIEPIVFIVMGMGLIALVYFFSN